MAIKGRGHTYRIDPIGPTPNTGFTLIELMVILVIVSVLAAVLIPIFQTEAEISKVRDELNMLGVKTEWTEAIDSVYNVVAYTEETPEDMAREIAEYIENPGPYESSYTPPVPKQEVDGTAVVRSGVVTFGPDTVAVPKTTNPEGLEYKGITDDIYMVYTSDAVAFMKATEKIRASTGKSKFEIIEEMSDGIMIRVDW